MNERRGLSFTLAGACLVALGQVGQLVFLADDTGDRVLSGVILALGLGVIGTTLVAMKRSR